MSIRIYNSLTRKKEEFIPVKPKQVNMYVCGPTVYDEPHIGHARSAYIFDVIRRYLSYRGFKVKFVRNVTDVDDKIIEKAKTEFKNEDLNESVKKVSRKYIDVYRQAMDALGIAPPDAEPKATEYIDKMIKFIGGLMEKGAAYQSGGDVYFDIRKAKDYGKLSHQSLDKMEIGARVSPGENKKDPLDFALWKAAKEGEPSWKSPWGSGRPGWHIECSVMSSDILGDEFDVHGGGIDLIFPHHENEIAQSEGAGKKFARYWIHNGLLTINGQKMAKSSGNFITIKDFVSKYKNVNLLKFFFLSTHYSHPVDYTEEKIEEAKTAINRFQIFIERVENWKKINPNTPISISQPAFKKKIEDLETKLIEAMDDDFNTSKALGYLFEILNETNSDSHREYGDTVYAKETIEKLGKEIFGIDLSNKDEQKDVVKVTNVKELIKTRNKARGKGDFKKADEIRKGLEAQGIILEDTKEGTVWRRKI